MTQGIFDSHAHIDFEQFADDRDEVIARAWEAGLCGILVPGVDLRLAESVLKLVAGIDNVYCAIGTHPNSAGSGIRLKEQEQPFFDEKLALRMAQDPKVVAVGEIGLDYYRDYTPHHIQQECVTQWLNWAARQNLPAIVHVRDAFDDAFAIIRNTCSGHNAGVLHCFSGDIGQARTALDLGYMISFAGQITYKSAHFLREVAQYVPLERMLVETDAPYLPPVPHRGERNQPAYIRHTVSKIAEIKKLATERVAEITTENACKLFKLDNL